MDTQNKNYNTIPAVPEAQANLLASASHTAYEYGDNRHVKDSSDQAMFQNGYKVELPLKKKRFGKNTH